MKKSTSLILAVMITFICISVLMVALQYSSDLINFKNQPENNIPTGVYVNGTTDNAQNNAPYDSGDQQSGTPEDAGDSIGALKLPSMSIGGNSISDPDTSPDATLSLLIIIVVIIVLVIILAIGFLIWRSRRGTPSRTVPINPAATGKALGTFEGDYHISFPQIREPFPLIWGVKEPLEVIIEGKDGADCEAVLDIDGQVAKTIQVTDGTARAWLKLEKGDHRLTIGTKGLAASVPSWADMRIVDYREEIVRIFNDMYLHYRSHDDRIKDEMTPREIEHVLSLNMPDLMRKTLGAAITIFEIANYSLHAIRRGDYERMYLSKMYVAYAPGGLKNDARG